MTDTPEALPPLPQPAVRCGEYAGPPGEGASESLWSSDQMHEYARAALAQRQQGPQVEWPDDGELEAWRSTADDLLKTSSPSGPTLRRAAHLLQNAYLFASSASPQAPAQPSAAAPSAQAEPQEPRSVIDQSWLDNKGKVLDAMRAAGLMLVNRGTHFEVINHPCGKQEGK